MERSAGMRSRPRRGMGAMLVVTLVAGSAFVALTPSPAYAESYAAPLTPPTIRCNPAGDPACDGTWVGDLYTSENIVPDGGTVTATWVGYDRGVLGITTPAYIAVNGGSVDCCPIGSQGGNPQTFYPKAYPIGGPCQPSGQQFGSCSFHIVGGGAPSADDGTPRWGLVSSSFGFNAPAVQDFYVPPVWFWTRLQARNSLGQPMMTPWFGQLPQNLDELRHGHVRVYSPERTIMGYDGMRAFDVVQQWMNGNFTIYVDGQKLATQDAMVLALEAANPGRFGPLTPAAPLHSLRPVIDGIITLPAVTLVTPTGGPRVDLSMRSTITYGVQLFDGRGHVSRVATVNMGVSNQDLLLATNGPEVTASNTPVAGAPRGTTRFTAESTGGEAPVAITWKFSDGTTAAGATVEKLVPKGTFMTATARATDANGAWREAETYRSVALALITTSVFMDAPYAEARPVGKTVDAYIIVTASAQADGPVTDIHPNFAGGYEVTGDAVPEVLEEIGSVAPFSLNPGQSRSFHVKFQGNEPGRLNMATSWTGTEPDGTDSTSAAQDSRRFADTKISITLNVPDEETTPGESQQVALVVHNESTTEPAENIQVTEFRTDNGDYEYEDEEESTEVMIVPYESITPQPYESFTLAPGESKEVTAELRALLPGEEDIWATVHEPDGEGHVEQTARRHVKVGDFKVGGKLTAAADTVAIDESTEIRVTELQNKGDQELTDLRLGTPKAIDVESGTTTTDVEFGSPVTTLPQTLAPNATVAANNPAGDVKFSAPGTFRVEIPITARTADGEDVHATLKSGDIEVTESELELEWAIAPRYTDADDAAVTADEANPSSWDFIVRFRTNEGECEPALVPHLKVGEDNVSFTVEDSDACALRFARPDLDTFTLNLELTDSGNTIATGDVEIEGDDLLVFSLGDSLSSGEGASAGGGWTDQQCHRSFLAGPSQAALLLEQSDPHTAVTFVHLACSGASTPTGLVGHFGGIEPAAGPLLSPQIYQMSRFARDREVDAVMLSIGANDARFASALVACATAVLTQCDTPGSEANAILDVTMPNLPTRYAMVNNAFANVGIDPGKVHLMEYPDSTTDDDGEVCDSGFDIADIFNGTIYGSLNEDEWTFLRNELAIPLNDWGDVAASDYGWRRVGGIQNAFLTHGLCATDTWMTGLFASISVQGNHQGGFHPNITGHVFYADKLYESLAGAISPGEGGGSPMSASQLRARLTPDRIEVSVDNFSVGDVVTINPGGANEETRRIKAKGSLIFDEPLYFDHEPGEVIVLTSSLDPATGTNQAPIAADDAFDVGSNGLTVLDVLANDQDPDDGDTLSVASVSSPNATIVDDTLVHYDTAGSPSCAPETFTYMTRDDGGATDTGSVTVTPSCEPPGPETTIKAGPVANVRTKRTIARFTVLSPVKGATFECRLDGGPWAPCAKGRITYKALAQGPHTFEGRARFGGVADSTPVVRTWTVDTTPPVINVTAPVSGATYTVGQVVVPAYTCSDPAGGSVVCKGPATVDTKRAGKKTFTVTAKDSAGNKATLKVNFTVVK